MGSDELFAVEVAYARPEVQVILRLKVARGTSVQEAIQHSGLLERFPEIDLGENRVGIFGRLARLDAPVSPGDRVEIYRPLIADPKEVRRRRAAEGKRMRKGATGDGET